MRIHRSLVFHAGRVSRRALLVASSSVAIIAILLTTAVILQRPQTSYAATPPDTCFAFDSGTGTVTGYYDHESNNGANPACPRAVDIPSTIGGVTVTTIGNYAFLGNQLTSVTIPNSVTSIGSSAFTDNQLSSVTIPDSVTTIGSSAFYNNQLVSVTIPHSVTSLSSSAFSSNPTLRSVVIAAPTIPSGAFAGLGLTSLTLEEGVVDIGVAAFANNQITSVTIPSSVTTIGGSAFNNNQLTSATINGNNLAIDSAAFANNQLTSLTLGDGVGSVGVYAFVNNNLSSVTINGNPIVGTYAFGMNGLDRSTLPSGITTAQTYDYYQTNAQFVRLYAPSPAFIAANSDTLYTDTMDSTTYTTSGYLINPATVTVRYVDTNGTALRSPDMHVSATYADYKLSSNLAHALGPSSYYRAGSTASLTAPAIAGYVLTSAATQSPTLTAGDNTVTFTYAAQVHAVPFATNSIVNYVSTSTTPPSAVTSDLITKSSLSIPTDANSPCQAISDARLVPTTSTLAGQVPATVSLLGGVDFTLHCTTAAETAVNYTLGKAVAVSALRVYKLKGTILTDITKDVTITSANGLPVISYSLIDGGDYDEDGTVNGTIVDPIYIGVVNASATTTPSSSAGTLAATGANAWAPLLIGGSLLLSGSGSLLRRRQ